MKLSPDALFVDSWSAATSTQALELPGPIIITGGSGFIGARLFYSLLSRRDDVYVGSQNPGRAWRLQFAPAESLFKIDIRDPNEVRRAISLLRPKTVFNLAAYGAYSWQTDADRIHSTNYMGTYSLLAQSLEAGVSGFVTSGSSSEYGLNCRGPRESDVLLPNSHYAVSKAGIAMQVQYYGKTLQFPCVNLRLYSIYGPWEDTERLVYKATSLALKGSLPPFAAAEISRDFVYVDDCTAAFIAAARHASKARGHSINIATGNKSTLRDVAGALKNRLGVEAEPEFGKMPNRAWDLEEWYGNPELAQEVLQWRATKSLEDGLELTADWIRHFEKLTPYHVSVAIPKRVSAIIACYKDDQAIPIMHRRLTESFRTAAVEYEIIFVNDGSPANDEAAIERLAAEDPHVIGVSHSRNFGSQAAFLSGIEVASGDAVVLLDGDLQDPPEVIPQLIEKWKEGYDVVYGQRTQREAPYYMQAFYKVFYRVFQALAEVHIPVDAGDFSLIDRKVVRHLMTLPERDVFLRGLRAWVGFRQIGISYRRPERMFGRTTNSFFKNIWWAKKGIFSFSSRPLHYIQALGFGLFSVCSGLILFYLYKHFTNADADPRGITTIIILVLALGSIQIICMSVLGDYISKITEEVKGRPRFIRQKIISGTLHYVGSEQINSFLTTQSKAIR